jgi:predicted dinucleotide-binding enzyme
LADAGHRITFGSRHPDDRNVVGRTHADVTSVGGALTRGEIIVLAVPAGAVPELVADHGDLLVGKVVIDAANQIYLGEDQETPSTPCSAFG